MSEAKRTLTISNRATGEVASVLDLTDMTNSEIDRMWRGLVYKVDFEKWMATDSWESDA